MLIASQQMASAALINDMQGCQGLIKFLEKKLDNAPSKYPSKDVKSVQKGIGQYNDYIQEQIVSPGLLKFNGGDEGKAKAMQKQVDDYTDNVAKSYVKRYPQNQLFYDHAIALNNCAKKAVPSGQKLENLKLALNKIVELSKIK